MSVCFQDFPKISWVCHRLMVSGASDATVSLFELHSLTCLRTSSKFDYPARGVSFSHDSQYIAFFAEGSNGVHIEKTFSGKFLAPFNIKMMFD